MLRSVRLLLLVGLGAMVLLAAVGCGGGGGGGDDSGTEERTISEEQAADMATAGSSISTAVAAQFDAGDPGASFSAIAASVKTTPHVASVAARPNEMVVTYDTGLKESWFYNPPLERPVFEPEVAAMQAAAEPEAMVGRRRAAVINVVANDSGFAWVDDYTDAVAGLLKSYGFEEPRRLDGDDADLDAFRSLSSNGVVCLVTHGVADGTSEYWLLTGDRIWVPAVEYVANAADWYAGRVRPSHLIRNVVQAAVLPTYWLVSSRFFTRYYADKHFPHAIFYNGACEGMKNTSMSRALGNLGVDCYLGWTEPQSRSPSAARALFGLMCGGRTVQQAIDLLPDYYVHQDIARLAYSPTGGGGMQVSEAGSAHLSVNIDSPATGSTVYQRVVTVRGSVSPTPTDPEASVFVNGTGSALTLSSDGSFSQAVALRAGENNLRVFVASDNGSGTDSVTVDADFSTEDIWTELAWDTATDVDLHLLRPGAGLDALWSSDDCYFGNKETSWGASLDVDDISGYGPEHITVNGGASGIYTLVVHYYSSTGGGSSGGPALATRSQVTVACGTGDPRVFGPTTMVNSGRYSGDVWTVARIGLPSGTISTASDVTGLTSTASIGTKAPLKRR